MGKRSNFERREADFYPTPRAAAVPLIPYLAAGGVKTFAEPCAGDGDLVRHLESFGLHCAYAGDIRTGHNALDFDRYDGADAIITNPPYTRDLMHRLIAHFQRILPTWLLLDADWAFTKQAKSYLTCCSDIVAIGRVKWIEGSKYTGKDNHAWYRFDIRHTSGPILHGCGKDEAVSPCLIAVCEQCRRTYKPRRLSSRYCSDTCRQRAHRKKLSVTSSVTFSPPACSELFRYVRHADVSTFMADGWEPLPAREGTHHSEYSLMMRRQSEPT